MVIYLYLDESGNLKLAKGPANYFVIAVLGIAEPAPLRQAIERARRHALPPRLRRLPEIKASLASDQFRGLVYRGLARLPLEIHTLAFNTANVPYYLRGKQGVLYCHLTGEVVSHALDPEDLLIYLSLDRRHLQGIARPNFDEHLRARLALGLPGNAHLEVYHRDSATDWGVQAVDFICWALYQKYQYGNTGWYEMIEAQIKTERLLFEPK